MIGEGLAGGAQLLWERVCAGLAGVDGVLLHEHFFDGVGATINMNLVVAVLDGDLIVHVGARLEPDELAGAASMTIGGQDCPGWVRVPAAAVDSDDALAEWMHRGVAQAQRLPMYDPTGWPERIALGYVPNTGVHIFGTYEEEDPAVTAAMEAKVRLSPDYGATLPLWGRWLDRVDVDEIDASLLDALREWQAEFDREFHYQRGWSSEAVRSRWAHAAIGLEERVRAALPPWVELEVDLWPLDR